MQLVCSRNIPLLDAETLRVRIGREALFRNSEFFVLYMSDGNETAPIQERLLKLSARQALLWLNEGADERGSFWG